MVSTCMPVASYTSSSYPFLAEIPASRSSFSITGTMSMALVLLCRTSSSSSSSSSSSCAAKPPLSFASALARAFARSSCNHLGSCFVTGRHISTSPAALPSREPRWTTSHMLPSTPLRSVPTVYALGFSRGAPSGWISVPALRPFLTFACSSMTERSVPLTKSNSGGGRSLHSPSRKSLPATQLYAGRRS